MGHTTEFTIIENDVTAPIWELMQPESFEMGDHYDSCGCATDCAIGCCREEEACCA